MRGQMIYRHICISFLLQSFALSKIEFSKRIITDPVLIKQYDDEFKYQFYTPDIEHAWLDTDVIMEHRYTKSKELLGYELQSIYVAVNDKDDNIDDPILRIHGRLLDGRQRYADSKVLNQKWSVKYVYVKDYEDFIIIWSSMGSKKSNETNAIQTKAIVRSYCDMIWKQKPKEIFDSVGVPRKEKVSAVVCKRLEPFWSKKTVSKYILPMYKEQYRIDNVAKRDSTPKKPSKLQQDNQRLKSENDILVQKNAELETRVMPVDKKDKMIKKQDSEIKHLKTAIGTAKSELRKIWSKENPDKKEEDFEDYLASLGIIKRMYHE